jgi:F-type H+-transporting ATPase subunit b
MCRIDARKAFALLLALSLVVMAPAAAQASAEGHGPATAAKAEGEGHGEKATKGGLSFMQLDRWDLGIFTLVVFGLLVIILQQTAWPKISEGLAKREASIQDARDEALAARREAENIRSQLQKEYAEAQDKIRALIDEARKDADALRAKEREAGTKDAAAERERAKREIEVAKDTALNDIYKQAVNLAAMISAKALGRQISIEDHTRLLDESLAELQQNSKA